MAEKTEALLLILTVRHIYITLVCKNNAEFVNSFHWWLFVWLESGDIILSTVKICQMCFLYHLFTL